jgi:hypothetical protein
MGVCGVVTGSCSSFVSCQSPSDVCTQSGYVCVLHTQCSSSPLCYPPTMFDQSACPPIPVSNYTGALTINSRNYTRPGQTSATYHYETIQVRVATTGTYTFTSSGTIADNYGYLYQGNFYPSYPQYNIIAQDDDGTGSRNFRFSATLRSDITYILVVTSLQPGDTGSFTIVASDPVNVSMIPI